MFLYTVRLDVTCDRMIQVAEKVVSKNLSPLLWELIAGFIKMQIAKSVLIIVYGYKFIRSSDIAMQSP